MVGALFRLDALLSVPRPRKSSALAVRQGTTDGVPFRRWVVAALGSSFTVTVGVDAQQELVARGHYRWVRHPSYSGSLLMLIGLALACSTWLAVATLLLPFGAYAYRIQVEESALSARFRDAYRSYSQRTTRLLPWML